jgi:hypothetical protein
LVELEGERGKAAAWQRYGQCGAGLHFPAGLGWLLSSYK